MPHAQRAVLTIGIDPALVHTLAPQARIAFNSNPTDTAEAARRWLD